MKRHCKRQSSFVAVFTVSAIILIGNQLVQESRRLSVDQNDSDVLTDTSPPYSEEVKQFISDTSQEEDQIVQVDVQLANFFSLSSSDDISLQRDVLQLTKETYPGLNFEADNREKAFLSTPSLVRHPTTNELFMGVRIILPISGGTTSYYTQNFLMLCTLRYPLLQSICQDSGIHPRTVPLSCNEEHFLFPLKRTFVLSIGPEDARLFFDTRGNLGASFTLRGCHPGTEWNETSPNYGVAVASWERSDTSWRLRANPYLLDVRKPDGSIYADNYMVTTKNWISLPPQPSPEEYLERSFSFSTGWTTGLKRNVVYQVSDVDASRELYQVTPAQAETVYAVDHRQYRGSTNFVEYRGFLLSIWHYVGTVFNGSYYLHYWHLMCPNPPYKTVATSGTFSLFRRMKRDEITSYALGLVVENDVAYVSWSAHDTELFLSRYPMEKVWSQLARKPSYVGEGFDTSKSVLELCYDAQTEVDVSAQ